MNFFHNKSVHFAFLFPPTFVVHKTYFFLLLIYVLFFLFKNFLPKPKFVFESFK